MELQPRQRQLVTPVVLRFGEFALDARDESLRQRGDKLNINRRMFQVLWLLADRQGEIISKEVFFEEVWGGSFVEDNNLTVTITALRKALGDSARQAKFIENIPRKGYRFIAQVEREGETEQSMPAADAVTAHRPAASGRRLPAGVLITLIVLGLAIGGIASMGFWRSSSPPADKTAARKVESVAVLPFGVTTSENEYLGDGLTDGIIADLSRLSKLRVIDRNSAFRYKGKAKDVMKAGRELNVRTVVTGLVEQQGDDIAVSVEMFDLESNFQLWRRQFRRRANDLLAIQQEISEAVAADALSRSGPAEQQLLTKRPTNDPEAYVLYLKGLYYWNKRANPDIIRSIDLFRSAIDRDPTFAMAYVGLANAYTLGTLTVIGISNEERISLSRGAVRKALEIDDTIGQAYAALAINKCYHDWNFAGAESDYRRAVELSPNDATAHHWFAEFLSMEGRFDESLAEYEKALSLDPLSLPIRTDMAFCHYYARDYDKAIEQLNLARQIDPVYRNTYNFLNFAYREKGMFQDAANAYGLYVDAQYGPNERSGKAYQNILQHIAAIKKLGPALTGEQYWRAEIEFEDDPDPILKAVAYSKLGEKDKAFEYLEQAFDRRLTGMVWLKVTPELDALRSDSRYDDLMRRVGF